MIALASAIAITAMDSGNVYYQEPSTDQAQILERAIAALQNSKFDQFHSRFSKEDDNSVYLQDAFFLARVHTRLGYLLVFRFTFIRSSSFQHGYSGPPRGHNYAVVFDDALSKFWWKNVDMPNDASLDGFILSGGQVPTDLRKLSFTDFKPLRN
jgi:hypothetical protein